MIVLMEALNSVALSHKQGCACTVCRAADGDKEAFYTLLLEIEESR